MSSAMMTRMLGVAGTGCWANDGGLVRRPIHAATEVAAARCFDGCKRRCMTRSPCRKDSKARPREAAPFYCSNGTASGGLRRNPLIAHMAIGGLFDLLEDPTQIVGFRSLQRREFLV